MLCAEKSLFVYDEEPDQADAMLHSCCRKYPAHAEREEKDRKDQGGRTAGRRAKEN